MANKESLSPFPTLSRYSDRGASACYEEIILRLLAYERNEERDKIDRRGGQGQRARDVSNRNSLF